MSNFDLIATRIREQLSGDKKVAYLQALSESKQGSEKLSFRDWEGSITHSMKAHDLLSSIPESAPILGTVKQNLGAAYGYLGKATESTKFSKEAIRLVKGVKELEFTEAMARMNIGIFCFRQGKEQEGSRYFSSARRLLKNQPESEQGLLILDHNEARVRAGLLKRQGKEEAPAMPSRTSEIPTVPASYTEPTTGIEMIFVKGGCYQMGDTFGDGQDFEQPVHEVCVGDFYLGKFPITQGQWKAVMGKGNNPAHFQKGDDYPLESVNWDDAQKFIQKLNEKTGKNYRLPTEAEWEYAARSGGKKEKWAGTSDESELMKYAWYRRNARKKTHPVGRKKPNGLGLYDMIGNVSEWVEDAFKEEAYRLHSRNNPIIPFGVFRVLRGGGWSFDADVSRSASRNWWFSNNPKDILNITGFRVARDV